MTFFNSFSFSSSNEDGSSELAAFAQVKAKRLLCLTGSGSRVLDMCLSNADELIALDLNPSQNELLRLKIAAFRTLTDSELYAYLGLTPSNNRLHLHERVERALPDQSRNFWCKHKKRIARGLWYCGLWEKILRFGATANRMLRGKKIDQLFAAQTLDQQSEIWRTQFDDVYWHTAIRLLGRRWVWTKIIGEPGGEFLPPPHYVEERLAGAFTHASKTFFFRDSEFANLVLRGQHQGPNALPLHMQEKHTDIVRNRLDRIRIVTGGLTDLRNLQIENVAAFSVSDFGSYCNQQSYEKCWDSISAAARPHAVVCEREFLNPLLPYDKNFVVDKPLSEKLNRIDKSFIYKIRVGKFGPQ